MCMLYIKPENFTMPPEYLASLKRRNGDGLAIYNKSNGDVLKTLNYTAGFKYMEENHANELVVHFRFGTSGEDTIAQLHAFPVCNNEYLLFHNGVLSSIKGDFKAGLSDTQVLVNIFRDEPVENLVTYLEKYEQKSRFLIVNKATKEYIIPKCAEWDGDSTINGTHIIFSNSYAIDQQYLDRGYKFPAYTGNSSRITTTSNSHSYNSHRNTEYYNNLWNEIDEDIKAIQEEEDEEALAVATIDIMEAIWGGHKKKATNLIKLYPDAAYQMLVDMMEEKEIGLPF